MNDANLEAELIIDDIVSCLVDYCSTQPDLDSAKAQSALLVAQRLDLTRLIGKANVVRRAKALSGDGGNAEILEQVLRESIGRVDGRSLGGLFSEQGSNIGEGVECALRFEAFDAGHRV